MARQLKLPVMLPSWVESTWEAGLDGHVTSATGDDIITSHRCPPLRGHTVTVTGLDERARQKVKELCAENGGTYSGELTKDICTHLLVGNKQSELMLYAHVYNYRRSGYFRQQNISLVKFSCSLIVAYTNVRDTSVY